MRILELDERRGKLRLIIETPEDLYYLFLLLRKKDLVYAWTFRQVRVERETGSEKGERVRVYVGLELEKIGYSMFTKSMRLTGRVVEAPEDLHMKGSYHTISITVGDEVTIYRGEGLGAFDKNILSKATSLIRKVLVVSIGDDEISIGVLSPVGVEVKGFIPYSPRKTDRDTSIKEAVLPVLKDKLSIIEKTYNLQEYNEVIVLTTERLAESVGEALAETGIKARIIKVSEGGEAGLNEMLKREDLRQLFVEVRSVLEAQEASRLIEELFRGSRRVVTGLGEAERTAEWGLVEEVVILDKVFFDEALRDRVFRFLNSLQNAKILIISGDSEAGRILKRLGGVIAKLYYEPPEALR
ncbi:MAG: hypothetical protein ABWK01_00665 [Infirmifilum sp.]